MAKRNIPETSRAAYQSLSQEDKQGLHLRILRALHKIQSGTQEDIARVLKIRPSRVWKRLSEMQRLELIDRREEKKPLASGRMGFVWTLTEKGRNADLTDNTRTHHKDPHFVQKNLF